MPRKAKILVIDDETDFSHFLKLNMEITGEFEVAVASESKTGLDLAKNWDPDLILLDIRLPGLSGPEIVSILQKEQSTKDIPVIFLTGLAIKEDSEEGLLKKNGSVFIIKPVATQDIINQIKPILAKKTG